MRLISLFLFIVLAGLILCEVAAAQVANNANIAKENGYAVLQTPTNLAFIAKENGYAILQLPTTRALIAKANAYVVVTPARPQVQFSN